MAEGDSTGVTPERIPADCSGHGTSRETYWRVIGGEYVDRRSSLQDRTVLRRKVEAVFDVVNPLLHVGDEMSR